MTIINGEDTLRTIVNVHGVNAIGTKGFLQKREAWLNGFCPII